MNTRDQKQIEAYKHQIQGRRPLRLGCSIALPVVLAGIVLQWLYVSFRTEAVTIVVLGIAAVAIGLPILVTVVQLSTLNAGLGIIHLRESLEAHVMRRQDHALKRLEAIKAAIIDLTNRLSVKDFDLDQFADYEGRIRDFVSHHPVAVLLNQGEFTRHVDEVVASGERDLGNLNAAAFDYFRVLERFDAVAPMLTRCENRRLRTELDRIQKVLESAEIRSDILTRNWQSFHDLMEATADEIGRLEQQAETDTSANEAWATTVGPNGMTDEVAFGVLGLPIGTPWEIVKPTFRNLANAWHPDKHENDPAPARKSAEARFMAIKLAYEYLTPR